MEAKKKNENVFSLGARIIDIEMQPFFYADIHNNIPLPKPKSKTILMIIDKSGSMEGDNIDQSKKVLKLLLAFFRNSLPDASLNLITFDMKSILTTDLNLMSLKEAEKYIDRIEADSSTYFTGVLKAMEDFIKSRKFIDDLSILFMTDGEIVIKQEKDNNFKILNDQIESLNKTLNTFTKDCDIHTIGLGKEHDPFLLEKLLTLKPLHSTYLFIIDETGIEPSFKAVKDMIFLNKIKGVLTLFDLKGKKPKNFQVVVKEIEQDDDEREWEIFHRLDYDTSEIDIKQCFLTISVSNGEIQEKYLLTSIIETSGDQNEESKFHLIKIRNDLSKILNALKHQSQANSLDIKQIDEFSNTKVQLFKDYHVIFLKIFKIKNQALKKKLFAFCEELSPMMNVIDELLSSAYISKIKNDVLAKAVQISHKNIKKKRYIKELKSRMTGTVRLYNDQDEEVMKLSKKFASDQETLYEKYKKMTEDCRCFLTCYDFIEAISDQDCLCITFDVSRSEAAIMCPSKIKITAIYPTIISAQSFLNAIKYSINLNFNENSIEKEHIIKGVAQESINAALPIFLCKEHWEIARILMDRILGWIVTLDPFGYHIRQKMTFPFLLLECNMIDSYKKSGSSFTSKYFRMILETCLNVMIDEENNKGSPFKISVIRHWDCFEKEANERLPENTSKGSLFFIRSFCAMILGWIKPKNEQIEEIYYFLIEEELRRCQTKEYNSYADYEQINIFKKTPEEQVELIEKFVKKTNDLFLENCLVMMLVKSFMMKYTGSIDDFDFKTVKLNETSDSLMLETKITDKTALFALIFQNQLHSDNASRKRAILNKRYVDCRKNWKDVFILYEEDLKTAQDKRQQQIQIKNVANIDSTKLRKKFRNIEVLNMLADYRTTDDMKEAEELLDRCLVIKPGRVLDYYLNTFIFGECNHLLDKLILFKKKHQKFTKIPKKFIKSLSMDFKQKVEIFGEENFPSLVGKK